MHAPVPGSGSSVELVEISEATDDVVAALQRLVPQLSATAPFPTRERIAERGAATVNLTSNPERAAANRLYQRLGFARRETNAYRYLLGG